MFENSKSLCFLVKEPFAPKPTSMDQEKWLSATIGAGRAAFDMAQAKLMRGNGDGAVSPATDEDYQLGVKGLEKAARYRTSGDLEAAKKLYQLSIELLMKVYKDNNNKELLRKIETAMTEAEAVQAKLAKRNSPTSLKSFRQKSFENITGSMELAVNRLSKHQEQPHASTRRRPQPAAAQTPSQEANDELTNTILADFYVQPESLEETTWNDIAGLEDVKQSLQEVAILPLIRPDLFTGLRKAQNILLYGPPGTGKTMLVRAVAHESQSHLFVCSASTVTSKWMGDAEKMVRKLFQMAHQLAPSVIFVDEIDALLSSRKSDGSEHEASRRLKTEFMVQMDGLKHQGGHLLIIGCTNTPWDVDSAVLRRLQRRIFVPLPDEDARKALFQHLLKKAGKHSLTSRHISTLVNRTKGFSCSDISAIASEASFGPLRELGGLSAMKKVSASAVRPVQLQDFEAVVETSTRSVSEAQLTRYDQWRNEQSSN